MIAAKIEGTEGLLQLLIDNKAEVNAVSQVSSTLCCAVLSLLYHVNDKAQTLRRHILIGASIKIIIRVEQSV
jgi:hypothetical protein